MDSLFKDGIIENPCPGPCVLGLSTGRDEPRSFRIVLDSDEEQGTSRSRVYATSEATCSKTADSYAGTNPHGVHMNNLIIFAICMALWACSQHWDEWSIICWFQWG